MGSIAVALCEQPQVDGEELSCRGGRLPVCCKCPPPPCRVHAPRRRTSAATGSAGGRHGIRGLETSARRRSFGSEEAFNRPRDLLTRAASSGLEFHDGAFVQPESAGQFGLGQPDPTPGRPQALRHARARRFWIEPKKPDEPAEVPDERPRPAPLPEVDGLLTHAQALGEGSLRQAEVESPAPEVLAKRVACTWATPWQDGWSYRSEPQAGKRQRNGARAAGAGTPSAGAGARRANSSSTPRA